MSSRLRFASRAAAAAVAWMAALADERAADACGGCFHPPNPPPNEISVVTDHRMAFALSPTQTVLWDQVRYSGDPREFAWVLPVVPGTRVELSRDEWFAALEASTQPVIAAPPEGGGGFGGGGGGGDYGGGRDYGGGGSSSGESSSAPASTTSSGCACGMFSSSSADSTFTPEEDAAAPGHGSADASASFGGDASGGANSGAGGGGAMPPVTVVAQAVVGPYETETLRSSVPGALENWLAAHGFDLPASIAPIIDAYVAEGFDFIALRLRPL
jgi:hypothetical protein